MIVDIDFLQRLLITWLTAQPLLHWSIVSVPSRRMLELLNVLSALMLFFPCVFDFPSSTDCTSLNFLANFDVDFLQTLRFV